MKLEIRKATISDAKEISILGRKTFYDTFSQYFNSASELETYLSQTFSFEKIVSSMKKPNNIFWLAIADEIPVGYAKLKICSWHDDANTQSVSQLQKIYVHQDYLDKKIGVQLLKHLEQEVVNLKSKELWLSVLNLNERAIKFYQKLRFKPIKKHAFTIGTQTFHFELMQKIYEEQMLDYNTILEKEETLDPENWENMKQLAHTMVDDMFDYMKNFKNEKVWTKPTELAKSNLSKTLPTKPEKIENVYADFKENVLPFNKGNIHPRFWSWVEGGSSPFAMMAEMLAAAMNPNVTIGDHAAMYVDAQVIDWLKEMINYPKTASGILLSGGTMANITAIVVARNAYKNNLARKKGLRNMPKMVVYITSETHSCIQKAVEAAGMGADSLQLVKYTPDFRMDVSDLKKCIQNDKEAGNIPLCVVGNAGTVNTGAIDPLDEILEICQKEKIWFHIDGAIGALAKQVPEYKNQLNALEHADSVALDLHKWLYVPYEVGCLLVKNKDLHRAAFAIEAAYLSKHERGLAAGPDPIANYGMELSRGFKSLKVWMSIKEHGSEKFVRLMRQNIAQSYYLGSLVEKESELELLTPVTMNIVCFRFIGSDPELDVNAINKEILMRLHEEGVAAPSYTFLNGKYAIRVANTNHRSRKSDFEAIVFDVLRIGRSLVLTSHVY